MPKIADIQETPNPNAVKFILKEPVSCGTSHSFKTPGDAENDKLAESIFDLGDVVSVFLYGQDDHRRKDGRCRLGRYSAGARCFRSARRTRFRRATRKRRRRSAARSAPRSA
ncbi:MAG: NifU N-terminal domain-containing protein [Acidobacteria bacterium]|nr:NifU N-terminal domain-containing protein [Acidobacteriota bacterium]